jgi:hypothetical protein
MAECHFWANVMLKQSHVLASRASPAQESQFLRVVCSKNFSRATFFVFWFISFKPWATQTKQLGIKLLIVTVGFYMFFGSNIALN